MTSSPARSCLTIVLAAGEGKRMASDMPKVLHPVAGLSMVNHVLNMCKAAGAGERAVVVGNQAERVANSVMAHDASCRVYEQTERKGTAHAVLSASKAITDDLDDVIILYGDVPLITTSTLQSARTALAEGSDIVVLGFETADPTGYGRLLVENGELIAIREHKDATDEEKTITLCNSGIMAFRAERMLEILNDIGNDNAQGEYYLTDAVEVGRAKGLTASTLSVPEDETLGVNDRTQLAEVNEIWQQRRRKELMLAGVTMENPSTVIFHHDTIVERDAVLEPYVVFGPNVSVAKNAVIRAFSHLEGATVAKDAVVGPYARLRPGAVMEEGSKAGNFVEIKAATIGAGAKVNHLSYIGDAEVGAEANIGAGTITCNYDGFLKHKTIIGEGAFIGSNTSLIAPVKVGKAANTAAGSAIYNDIPDDDLAIERNEQANLSGKAKQLRERNAQRKAAKKSS